MEIYRNFIWATRFAADLSLGSRKLIYFLGGVDNWLIKPDIYTNRQPNPNENYAYQTLAVNMRGYKQNIRNGNNVMLMNTELRLPVITTFIDKPINSAFLRNFQLMAFMDIGTAWNEKLSFKDANYTTYVNPEGVVVRIKGRFPRALCGRLWLWRKNHAAGLLPEGRRRLADDGLLQEQAAGDLRDGG